MKIQCFTEEEVAFLNHSFSKQDQDLECMGWKEISASSRPRWEIATEPSVKKQFPSKMWKSRAGDKLFLPSSFAVPINTMPVTVGHVGSTRTQRLVSALFSPTSWTRCMHHEASGTAPNSPSNTVSQKSAFGI